MPKTKSGVYYDLTESEFMVTASGITFFFSSASHMAKFQARIGSAITEFNDHILKRYAIRINARYAPALALYKKIETRGFFIVVYPHTERSHSFDSPESAEKFLLWGGVKYG